MEHCPECGQLADSKKVDKKRENFVTGLVGAILGAVIGGASIILLSQLGYIASVSGLILAVCTLKGYELLGGKLSIKGIVASIILVLVTPYLADRIDWAIVLMQEWTEYGVTFGECFAVIPALLEDGSIEMGMYIKNLVMIYGFAALGAFSTLKNALRK
jgi:hypothetical protein